MMRKFLLAFFILLGLLVAASGAATFDIFKWFPFNQENALKEWQEKVFKGRVFYTIEKKRGDGYLLAQSHDASSGLLYRIKLDIKKYPMISWQWRVKTFPKRVKNAATDGWVERDDYAARVYVIFPSWNFMNIKSLEYVWDETRPVGTILTSPYFKNIKLIVVESGKRNFDRWAFEERNIGEDYKRAFKSAPPRYAGAIAIMTDADNSSSNAEAMYKDLKVGYKK